MTDAESTTDAKADLTAAARLFGRLLVRELDETTLAELRQPEVAAALEAIGVELPSAEQLPALASAYFECFLHPQGSMPLVQSLWQGGQYDGDPAVGMRKIAAAAGRELGNGARAAAPDHLGCILLLWADLHTERPELAALLVEHHLKWANAALRHVTSRTGFYGDVARATTSLILELHDPTV